MLPAEQDAKLVKNVVTSPAIFLVHFDVKQLGVVADATAVTTTVAAVANAPAVGVPRLVDELDKDVWTTPADEYLGKILVVMVGSVHLPFLILKLQVSMKRQT